jgi:hypothetical protein
VFALLGWTVVIRVLAKRRQTLFPEAGFNHHLAKPRDPDLLAESEPSPTSAH